MRVVEFGYGSSVQPATVECRKHLNGAVFGADDVDTVVELGNSSHLTVHVNAGQVTRSIRLRPVKPCTTVNTNGTEVVVSQISEKTEAGRDLFVLLTAGMLSS